MCFGVSLDQPLPSRTSYKSMPTPINFCPYLLPSFVERIVQILYYLANKGVLRFPKLSEKTTSIQPDGGNVDLRSVAAAAAAAVFLIPGRRLRLVVQKKYRFTKHSAQVHAREQYQAWHWRCRSRNPVTSCCISAWLSQVI